MTCTRVLAAAVLLVGLPGCGAGQAAEDDGRLDVVVSSYPLQHVAEQVGGRHVDVVNLTPPGGDTHRLDPAPREVAALSEADVVVHLSGGLQPAVDEVLERERPDHLVDAAAVADRGPDPHFWLDPLRLAQVGRDVADELSEVDPAHAADYDAAAARLEKGLRAIDRAYTEGLAVCDGATLLASHEAFGYLAERYGLRQVGVAGLDPNVEPSPSRVRAVAEEVGRTGARTIFFEAPAGSGVADVLADDLGLATDVLHPIERVAAGETYDELMRANLAALQRGLVCG
ncbi:zinc ABC transporter substrate-binding protein [Blastococcus sp. TBT05-19]|uniref:metal ABC transporter substrate-binding protein n=1 Tax=Blastococcus sp. TBT05-19 TaxID=2250581 RepID=UPI000DEB5DE5|nr:zinc ABC transporter substrate-binding protein [Blastococcus sp. TBT05-19]RBY94790.1 zinc ABC transporter substrate-binding protein [Blastococcus sp. TBT05-19]